MENIDLVNTLLLVGAFLILSGIFSSLIASRFSAPLLLVFLGLGMLAGEDGPGGISFDDYELTYLVGSLALAVILFDGGLRTKVAAFRGVMAPSLLLATFGVFATAGLTALAVYFYQGQLSFLQAFLMGSIVASTDAAAVFFLLRTGGLQLDRRVGSVLEIESGTNDPVAVFLAVILTEMLLAGVDRPGLAIIGRLAEQGAIGGAFGVLGGLAAASILNRMDMPAGLHPLFAIFWAILLYAATSIIGGSGLLAAYLAGLVMANRPVRAYPSIVNFHDAATWLSQIVMFLLLGLLVTPTTLWEYAVPGILVALFLTFIARPVAVWLCLTPFGFTIKERAFVSWVGLRGAVSIFLAAIPTLAGVPGAEIFFNVAFFVVLLSLLTQGWTLTTAARRLGVALMRTAPNVTRIELDIPGQVEQEIVGYPVSGECLVLGLSKLPDWARPVLLVRDQQILTPDVAGLIQAGDYVYCLAPTDRVPRLDRLFSESPDVAKRFEPLFGELSVNGDANLGDIADVYGLDVLPSERSHGVAEYFEMHLKGKPQPGHRLPLGKGMLFVRVVEGDQVRRAALQLQEIISALRAGPLSGEGSMRQMVNPPRRLFRALHSGLRRKPGKKNRGSEPPKD